ncbi:hook protein [Providencia stuartii]|uniref:hook protein n=1 Tax=Providencia TaxID=586 RepID=UPI000D8CB5BB|nr:MULTISPECIES: hook protein [Providencia]EMA3643584.1 hook protein [Providencia stuartii]MBN5560271.1 hook protein [Providencia stuartii]MBW3103510.1 hook protein [Providencia stuartii]MCB5219982.1 hook protein [Providencia stuartii]MEB3135146.1 hook protein [Providencia stuartii]
MTIEQKIQKIELATQISQLKEENAKLKKAITDIYRNCEECEFDGSGTYYAVEQDHVNDAYELVDPTE